MDNKDVYKENLFESDEFTEIQWLTNLQNLSTKSISSELNLLLNFFSAVYEIRQNKSTCSRKSF